MHPVLRFLAHFYDVLIYILLAAAALTGESVPSEKSVDPVDPDAGIGDRSSMLFSSALVSAGQGIGVVTATGQQAEIGRITTMLAQIDHFDTPLIRQITAFSKKLAAAIGAAQRDRAAVTGGGDTGLGHPDLLGQDPSTSYASYVPSRRTARSWR